MNEVYVLIGEYKGYYADRYERAVEALAVSTSTDKLRTYWEENRERGFGEFIDHRIEKVPNIDQEESDPPPQYSWCEKHNTGEPCGYCSEGVGENEVVEVDLIGYKEGLWEFVIKGETVVRKVKTEKVAGVIAMEEKHPGEKTVPAGFAMELRPGWDK